MHVYQDSPVEAEAVRAYTAPLPSGGLIAVVDLDRSVRIHLHTAADCDALIAAAVEAKRLLSPPPAPEWCPSDHSSGMYGCTLERGHKDLHQSVEPGTGRVRARWDDPDGGILLPADCDPDNADNAPSLCESELPLKSGGVLKCTLDNGHGGTHSALGGRTRWLNEDDQDDAPEGKNGADL